MAACISLALLISSSSASDKRVVLVVAGGISIRDIAGPSLPGFSSLYERGAVGLMNVRAGRTSELADYGPRPGMEAGCITLGAGAPAVGGAEAGWAAEPDELLDGIRCVDIYSFRTGMQPDNSAILHTQIMRLRRANEGASYRAIVGNLGTALRRDGIPVTCIGNSDTPGELRREAACIAMDSDGRVPYGAVARENILMRNALSPYGVSTDVNKLLRLAREGLNRGGLIVIDFGDTLRADLYSSLAMDRAIVTIRGQAVRRLDTFIIGLDAMLDKQTDLLMVLSPSSRSTSDLEMEKLAPIVVAGPGFARGTLTSPSTRTESVVTLSDVPSTILDFLGATANARFVGRPIRSVDDSDALEKALNRNLRASLQAQRQAIMRSSSVAQLVVVALVTLTLFLARSVRSMRAIWTIALIPATMPVTMLYLTSLYDGGLVGSAIGLIILSLSLSVILGTLVRDPRKAVAALGLLTAASITVDLWRGSPLISTSIAGYSVIEGARYYGIGNELMGTTIGAAIAGLSAASSAGWMRRGWKGTVSALVLGMMCISIGLSALGANVGGALSAVPASLAFLLARRGWRLSTVSVLIVVFGTIAIIAGMLAFDTIRGSGAGSHAGMAVASAGPQGGGLAQLAYRKISLNLLLVVHSPWSRLLGVGVVCCALLQLFHRRDAVKTAPSKDESAACVALTVATAAAFALNDSGVVAAATCIVWLWTMLVARTCTEIIHPLPQT